MDRWEEPPIPNRLLVQLGDRRDLVDGEEFFGVCHERNATGRGKRHLVAFRVQPPDSNGSRQCAARRRALRANFRLAVPFASLTPSGEGPPDGRQSWRPRAIARYRPISPKSPTGPKSEP